MFNRKINKISSFSFRYTTGNYMDAWEEYRLTENGVAYSAYVKKDGIPDEQAFKAAVDGEFADKLTALLNKYNIAGWDGFQKYNKLVLDGNSFTLSVKTSDGRDIYANGYMRWPKHYREARDELTELFHGLTNEA